VTPPRKQSKQEKIISSHQAHQRMAARQKPTSAVAPLKKSEIPDRLAVLAEAQARTTELAERISKSRR
jgi:hypothetical protein